MSPGEALLYPAILIAPPGKLPRHELPIPAQWQTAVNFVGRPVPGGFRTDSFPVRTLRTDLWTALVIDVPPEHPAWDEARALRGDIRRELPYHLEKD